MTEGERVRVYRNLKYRNGRKIYSVIGKSGRVIAHVDSICLVNVKFTVQKAGQARVRKENRKNVHAFIVGTYSLSCMGIDSSGKLPCKITYNPYKDDKFRCDLVPAGYVSGALACVINQHGVFAAYIS
jgi:hypothetical protein